MLGIFVVSSLLCAASGESLFDDALIADISGTIPTEAHFQHGDELINVLMDYPNVEPQHEGMQGAAVVQQRQVKTLQTSMATALRTAVAMEPLTAVEPDSASCRTLTDAQRLRLATLVGQSFGYWALLGLTGVYLILAIALIAVYFNRRAHPAVSPRSPLFVQISAFSGFLVMLAMGIGRNIFLLRGFYNSMDVYDWVQNVGLPILLIPQFLRAHRLRALHGAHNEKMRAAKQWLVDDVSSSKDRQYEMEAQLKQDGRRNAELRYALHFVWICMLLFGYAAVWQWAITSCRILHTSETLVTVGLNVILTVGYWLTIWLLRAFDEPFLVKTELYIIGALCTGFQLAQAVIIVTTHTAHAEDSWANAFPISFEYHCAVSAWIMLMLVAELALVAHATRVPRPPKFNKNEIFDSFSDFFNNEIGRKYFEQYLDLELCSESVLFWSDVEAYRQRFSGARRIDGDHTNSLPPPVEEKSVKAEDAKMRIVARNIYTKYIKDGSMLDLNLDQSLVLEIGDRLTSNISAYLFDAAQDAIYVKMSQIYQRFLVHAVGKTCIRHLRGELDENVPKDVWHVTDKTMI